MRLDDHLPTDTTIATPEHRPVDSAVARHLLAGFGLAMVGIGVVGLFVPVLPTVPFLIVAAWAFSRSSRRFHDWIYRHPRFGPPLHRWNRYGVIPMPAKILATAGLWASVVVVAVFVAETWIVPALHISVALLVSAYVLTRPSRAPG